MSTQESDHRKASESSESNLSDPYRYACPNGHIFERVYHGEAAYCYTCDLCYSWDDLVDRADADRWRPSWARNDE